MIVEAVPASAAPRSALETDDPASLGIVEYPAAIVIDSISGHQVPPDVRQRIADLDRTLQADQPDAQESSSPVSDPSPAPDTADPSAATPSLLPSVEAAATVGGFEVSYNSSWPAPGNAQSTINAAVGVWSQVLSASGGPVVIEVYWADLGDTSLLGYAASDGVYTAAGLPTSDLYPAALINTLLNTDANGSSRPEAVVVINSQLADTGAWYIGTSGTPGFNQFDLFTVVLHELGHAFGFSSLASDAATGSPQLESPLYVFERNIRYNGTSLASLANPNSVLRSDNLLVDVSNADSRHIYAPSTWQQGSSIAHFDEGRYPAGSVGSLMTPGLASREVERQLDSVIVGVLAEIGWPMLVRATEPSITSSSANGNTFTVNWDQQLHLTGQAPDSYRIELWRNGALESTVTVSGNRTSASVVAAVAGASYEIRVVPIADGGAGVFDSTTNTASGVPNAPASIISTGSGLTQTISWPASAQSIVSRYEVQHSQNGGAWTPLANTTATSTTHTFAEGSHRFRVRAVNQYGASGYTVSISSYELPFFIRPLALDGQISRLYRAYFLRQPDQAGFDYWVDQRASGLELKNISDYFADGAEFTARYGNLNNTQFLNLVYNNVLNRAPDAEGLSYWLGQLNGGLSRGEVMTGFSEGTEFITVTGTVGPHSSNEGSILRLYSAAFQRSADAKGLAYWVGVMNGGTSLMSVAEGFVSSAEFNATYGSLSNQQFVDLVYLNVLLRKGDAGGVSFWRQQLDAGTSRGQVLVGFSESKELILRTGTLP